MWKLDLLFLMNADVKILNRTQHQQHATHTEHEEHTSEMHPTRIRLALLTMWCVTDVGIRKGKLRMTAIDEENVQGKNTTADTTHTHTADTCT